MNEEQRADIYNFLNLAEVVIKRRKLEKRHHQDEFEKFFQCLIQGTDTMDVYERRDADIGDEQWDLAKYKFFNALGMEYEIEMD